MAIKARVAEKANDSAKNTVVVGEGFKVLGGRKERGSLSILCYYCGVEDWNLRLMVDPIRTPQTDPSTRNPKP